MKEFINFRLFKKVCRKYFKKHAVKRIGRFQGFNKGKRFVSYWPQLWCFYLLRDKNMLDLKNIYDSFKYDISSEDFENNREYWKSLFGKKVKFTHKGIAHEDIFNGFKLTNTGVDGFIGAELSIDGNENQKVVSVYPLFFNVEEA